MSTKVDPSFDIHPNTKGSYRRRAEDISRALSRLKVGNLSNISAFLIYYFSCEKLAKIMIGVSQKKPAAYYFGRNYQLHIDVIKSSSKHLNCLISNGDIDWIFSTQHGSDWNAFLRNSSDRQIIASFKTPKSARLLRNQIVHDIGPTHAAQIQDQAQFLIAKMKRFLDGSAIVIQNLTSKHSTNP